MYKATPVGTVSLEFLDRSNSYWASGTTGDIFTHNLITPPPGYFLTLGSGVASYMTSLATTPAYCLPTNSQFYLAGRDVFRWGGTKDPNEVDVDHYGFTPNYAAGAAVMWMAPKSEPHHLSELPQLLTHLPEDWQEFCMAILEKKLP